MIPDKPKKLFAIFLMVFVFGFLTHATFQQSEAAKAFQYKVISIQSSTELRTPSSTEGGRMPTIEKIINDQAASGWQFVQADGNILYFRR